MFGLQNCVQSVRVCGVEREVRGHLISSVPSGFQSGEGLIGLLQRLNCWLGAAVSASQFHNMAGVESTRNERVKVALEPKEAASASQIHSLAGGEEHGLSDDCLAKGLELGGKSA